MFPKMHLFLMVQIKSESPRILLHMIERNVLFAYRYRRLAVFLGPFSLGPFSGGSFFRRIVFISLSTTL